MRRRVRAERDGQGGRPRSRHGPGAPAGAGLAPVQRRFERRAQARTVSLARSNTFSAMVANMSQPHSCRRVRGLW